VLALIRLVFVLRNTSLSDRNGLNGMMFSAVSLEKWPFVGRYLRVGDFRPEGALKKRDDDASREVAVYGRAVRFGEV
jgi:hypothetical protein